MKLRIDGKKPSEKRTLLKDCVPGRVYYGGDQRNLTQKLKDGTLCASDLRLCCAPKNENLHRHFMINMETGRVTHLTTSHNQTALSYIELPDQPEMSFVSS